MTLGDRGTLFVGTRAGRCTPCSPAIRRTGRTVLRHDRSGLEHPQRRRVSRRCALRRRDPPGPPVRRDRIAPVLPAQAGRRHRQLPEGRAPRLEVHRASVRTGCCTCPSARRATSAKWTRATRDHADEAGWSRARGIRARGAQHRRLRLAPGHEGAVVHRQRPRPAGRRSSARRVEPCAAKGLHFGFPFCPGHHRSGVRQGDTCAEFTPPARELGRHVASLGMRFYTGEDVSGGVSQPDLHRRARLVEPHRSRSATASPRPARKANRAVGYEPFAEGWLQGGGPGAARWTSRRCPDGSLLVSDDMAGEDLQDLLLGD